MESSEVDIVEKKRSYTPEQKARQIIASAAWHKRNPDKIKAIARRTGWRRKGIDPVAAAAVLAAHNGYCDCCGATKSGGHGWSIDHDHITGRIRGVLCMPCNTAIGKLGDTLDGVLQAVKYLSR